MAPSLDQKANGVEGGSHVGMVPEGTPARVGASSRCYYERDTSTRPAMRKPAFLLIGPALMLGASLPALAQSPTSNLNRINESLARQGEMRSLQQQQTSDNNLIRMNQQRAQQSAPPPTGPVIIAPPR
ncbi:hypothetical protein [Methylobacterium sp. sgz302541]|uniref:hypothetical protein n=1 Tax=unclassified Methylobacterium TaxID=2615210 RepID=UPI003D34451F